MSWPETMAYTSVFRIIAYIAEKSGLFGSYQAFVDKFVAIEEEVRENMGKEHTSLQEWKDFFDYRVESEFWYRVCKYKV